MTELLLQDFFSSLFFLIIRAWPELELRHQVGWTALTRDQSKVTALTPCLWTSSGLHRSPGCCWLVGWRFFNNICLQNQRTGEHISWLSHPISPDFQEQQQGQCTSLLYVGHCPVLWEFNASISISGSSTVTPEWNAMHLWCPGGHIGWSNCFPWDLNSDSWSKRLYWLLLHNHLNPYCAMKTQKCICWINWLQICMQ